MPTATTSPAQTYDLIRQRTKNKDQRRQELRNSFQHQDTATTRVPCLA